MMYADIALSVLSLTASVKKYIPEYNVSRRRKRRTLTYKPKKNYDASSVIFTALGRCAAATVAKVP